MIVVTATLLGFAVADLLNWSVATSTWKRTFVNAALAAAACAGVAALGGHRFAPSILVLCIGSFITVSTWIWLSGRRTGAEANDEEREPVAPLLSLTFMLLVVAGAFALSGSFPTSAGPLDTWYRDLPFTLAPRIPLDQFLLVLAAALFLLATANQIIRLLLHASGTPVTRGESTLKGGRVLGPMERLFVMAMIISGAIVATAALIAAKGLLRLPEIRSTEQEQTGQSDEITEYFLIGTFASVLLAAALGGVVAAAGLNSEFD